MKSKILIIIILAFSLRLFADCPHCYTMSEVKILLKNGKVYSCYCPIFAYYFKGSIETNSNIIEHLSSDVDSITIYQKIYNFSKLPFIVCSEEKEKISRKSISEFSIINWLPKMSGAIEPPTLHTNEINKIRKTQNFCVAEIEEGLAEVYFVNTSNSLDSIEFKLFVNNLHTNAKPNYKSFHLSFYYKYNEISSKNDSIYNPNNMLIILETFNEYKKYITTEIANLNRSYKNESVKNYLSHIKTSREKELQYYELLIKYLSDKNKNKMISFIENNIENEYSKKTLIEKFKNLNEVMTIKEFFSLIEINYVFNYNYYTMNNLLENIIKENSIIRIIQSYD